MREQWENKEWWHRWLNSNINEFDLLDIYRTQSNHKRVFIFKCTEKIYHSRPYSAPQNRPYSKT